MFIGTKPKQFTKLGNNSSIIIVCCLYAVTALHCAHRMRRASQNRKTSLTVMHHLHSKNDKPSAKRDAWLLQAFVAYSLLSTHPVDVSLEAIALLKRLRYFGIVVFCGLVRGPELQKQGSLNGVISAAEVAQKATSALHHNYVAEGTVDEYLMDQLVTNLTCF